LPSPGLCERRPAPYGRNPLRNFPSIGDSEHLPSPESSREPNCPCCSDDDGALLSGQGTPFGIDSWPPQAWRRLPRYRIPIPGVTTCAWPCPGPPDCRIVKRRIVCTGLAYAGSATRYDRFLSTVQPWTSFMTQLVGNASASRKRICKEPSGGFGRFVVTSLALLRVPPRPQNPTTETATAVHNFHLRALRYLLLSAPRRRGNASLNPKNRTTFRNREPPRAESEIHAVPDPRQATRSPSPRSRVLL